VVVVDDGSTDEDRQAMLRAHPRAHYVFKDPPPPTIPTPTPGAADADADADAPHGGGDGAVGPGAGAGAGGKEGEEGRRRRYAQWAAEHGVASLQVAPSPPSLSNPEPFFPPLPLNTHLPDRFLAPSLPFIVCIV